MKYRYLRFSANTYELNVEIVKPTYASRSSNFFLGRLQKNPSFRLDISSDFIFLFPIQKRLGFIGFPLSVG